VLIRLGYDITFQTSCEVAMVALVNVHPSRIKDLREPDVLRLEPEVPVETFADTFGNICSRFVAPAGMVRLYSSTLIEDSGREDETSEAAQEVPVGQLPAELLQYLLASRYCEVDLLSNTAHELFGSFAPGWTRVKAICDWVQEKVRFGYSFARSTKTALDVYTERMGVCRDFQHLAITFCRGLNIPARYVTGYLGDIGVPAAPYPMDFSAWFEAYLDGRWWTFDARHNRPRVGRVVMATGRDAVDVAITTSFGSAALKSFEVTTDEVKAEAEEPVAAMSHSDNRNE
jgi:transglutaminase-like putative cysteine protease